MFAPFKHQASAYSNIHLETGVQGADPHQLVTMLLDGAIGAIAGAVNLLRLTQANLGNDAAMLRECSELLSPTRDAWNSIKPQRIAA